MVLGGAAHRDGADQGFRIAGADGGAVLFQPLEEVGIVDQPVLHDLGIAGQHVAAGQGGECRRVGQHQPGLVERSHEVLTLAGVDTGLAADGAVHLGQQRGRDLDEIQAAQGYRGGEAHQIPDHAAAEGDQHGRALDPTAEHLVQQGFPMGEAFGLLQRAG